MGEAISAFAGRIIGDRMSRLSLPMLARMERADLAKVLEEPFAVAVSEYARNAGWLVAYTRKSGYKDSAGKWHGLSPHGEPDLRMARRGRYIAAELKTMRGRVRPEQEQWLNAIGDNGYLWRPSDADYIMRVLG
jgi:hypothetical protein